MPRPLRYAPAVAFALLALALVGLWVRSNYYLDRLRMPLGGNSTAGCSSYDGVIGCGWGDDPPYAARDWFFVSILASETSRWDNMRPKESLGFSAWWDGGLLGYGFSLPHWFLALSALVLATLLAFKPITRFTVRGLLITTTLLAAVLGLAVYQIAVC